MLPQKPQDCWPLETKCRRKVLHRVQPAGFPVDFISMRRPTKTHILTSCREARIETCQANPLPTWKTDLFTHESLSLLRLYWRPFSTHRTYLLLKTLQQHLVGVRCGSVPFRSSTGLTARLTHVRGVAKNILDLTRKTFRKKYND